MAAANGHDEGWSLCIDFGTAYSKAAVAPMGAWAKFDPGSIRPLTIGGVESGNPFLLDSAVFIDDHNVLLGRSAIARAAQLEHTKRQALKSFKTLLSAPDLERTLGLNLPLPVDPHRRFHLRDMIVLYLAFLTRAIDRAIAVDPVISWSPGPMERRYASPAWRGAGGKILHGIIVGLFGQARRVQEALGDALLAPEGIEITAALAACRDAREAGPDPSWKMGMIFEATAAAAYSSIGLEDTASHLIVVDMGAGTTDFAAIARGPSSLHEIPEARVTLTRAGDFIDRVLLNLAVENCPSLKTPAQQAELWRALAGAVREIKENLFHDNRAAIRHAGKTITVNIKDLSRDKDFREFEKLLTRAFERGLDAALSRAKSDGEQEIDAIAVGGGAAAPFIQELIKKRKVGKVRVTPRPATPEWAHAPAFGGNLAPIFPQLAIAIGGALAPQSLLAAT